MDDAVKAEVIWISKEDPPESGWMVGVEDEVEDADEDVDEGAMDEEEDIMLAAVVVLDRRLAVGVESPSSSSSLSSFDEAFWRCCWLVEEDEVAEPLPCVDAIPLTAFLPSLLPPFPPPPGWFPMRAASTAAALCSAISAAICATSNSLLVA